MAWGASLRSSGSLRVPRHARSAGVAVLANPAERAAYHDLRRVASLTRLGRRLLAAPSDRGLGGKGCGREAGTGAAGRTLCADAARVVPLGVSALRSPLRPDQFATTTPVITAVATTRPSPSAVISQVSSRDQPRVLSFVPWL